MSRYQKFEIQFTALCCFEMCIFLSKNLLTSKGIKGDFELHAQLFHAWCTIDILTFCLFLHLSATGSRVHSNMTTIVEYHFRVCKIRYIYFGRKGNYYGFEMESDELTKIGPIFAKLNIRKKLNNHCVNNKSFSSNWHYPIY